MSPKTPRVTGRGLLAALRRDGWLIDDQTGSHVQLEHPTKPGKVTVPMHGAAIIGPRILRSILQQAGLSVDDLRRLI